MSLFALPVTVDDILLLQDSIQFFTNQAQATSQAAAINAETSTVYDYAQQLLAANLATSQVAVAVPSLILNETPTVGVIENITLNFLPDQIDFAISQGLDPVVYAAEAWAVNVASSNAADFNALYGNLNSTQFAAVVSTTTGVNTDAILNFIANWQAFFSANPNAIPPNLNVTTASYAAAFGDAIGNALVDDSVFTEGVNAFAENALLTIATGQYLEGVPPGAIPQHTPLQGEPGSDLRLTIGVDDLTTSVPGAVFDGAPAGNPPLGLTNTLNTGDSLTSTVGDAVLDFTAVDTDSANPPFALGVTMNGIATANILNLSEFDTAGFSGDITGLTAVTVEGGSVDFGIVQVGAPGLGAGLNTALELVTINTSHFFDAFFEATAFTGAEALGIVLNGVDATFDLEVNSGTTAYGQIDINSAVDPNILTLDVDFDTVATITASGDQDLDVDGSALFMDTLELFDGTAATGDLTAFFGGTGDVTVEGGSGDDDFTFGSGNGAVTVNGNGGDDVFTFETDAFSPTTFGPEDLADGGAGNNRLRLQADTGALLVAGVGGSILNIQVIEHFEVPVGVTGPISVNMAESGSANTLDLAAIDYANQDVTVTNLLNSDTVIFTGTGEINDLSLDHTNVVGVVNLVLAQTVVGGTHQIDNILVADGNQLSLVSTGNADQNDIDSVNQLDADVSISGDVDLEFGVDGAGNYNFADGIVDASTFTGNLSIAIGNNSQTVIGGFGDDLIIVEQQDPNEPDLIDLSVGGNDTVEFEDTNPDDDDALTSANYTTVTGFDVDNDVIAIDVTFPEQIDLQQTNGPDVDAGDAVSLYPLIFGVDDNLAGVNVNFIQMPSVSSIGFDFDATFDFYMAANGGTSITVAAGADLILMSMYDTNGGNMVLFTVDPDSGGAANVIDAGDDLQMVALAPMTFADYQTFGTNGSLTFV